MNKFLAVGLGAAAVVAVLLIGSNLLGSASAPPGGEVPESVAPSEAPASVEPPADAFLPEGPFLILDPSTGGPPLAPPSITVTIQAPEWSFNEDWGFLHKGSVEDDTAQTGAVVWPSSLPPGTGIYVYGDPCHWASTRPETPASTVDEVVAALASQASGNASEPIDVMIGGYAGKTITLHVPDPMPTGCDDQETWGSYEVEGFQASPWLSDQSPGQINQSWILDVEGSFVIITGWYWSDTPDELVEEVQAIVESATFEAP